MKEKQSQPPAPPATYYVDEAGDGVLFGPMGRNRLQDPDSPKFFMLGMVRCQCDEAAATVLESLRQQIMADPLYSGIRSLRPEERKTARAFHAKDDHAEIRAKVFELLRGLEFTFFAVIKDMRTVLRYVEERNRMHANYRYHPNELYDLTVRMLFKERLHTHDEYRITFARRGQSDRSAALVGELGKARQRFLVEQGLQRESKLDILPAYPWEKPCLQVADYCMWALQRCYEKQEDRFLKALWPKVSLIHDVDATEEKKYGTYYSRKNAPPDPEKIKNRWV